MKKTTKFLATTLSLLLMGATACAPQSGGLELEYDFTESENKIEYTFFAPNWQNFEGLTHDRVLTHIEDKFNVSINIMGAGGSWEDRLATEIADNNTPDLVFSLPDSATFINYINKQVITDINPYIEKANATNLSQILATEQYKNSTTVNGKNYFVPQSVGYTTRIMLVRKDWMKKWNEDTVANGGRGLTGDDVYSEPQTLSEFTSMLTYFREKDPDGDGRKNTYGLALSNNFDYLQDLFATFGIKPEYCFDANGDFQISALTENYKTMLEWFKAGNQSGVVYSDFYAQTEGEAMQTFYRGVSGAIISSGDGMLDGVINEIGNAYPDKNYQDLITLITPPDSDDGAYQGAFKGWNFYWGGWCVSATAKEPMRLIKILDYLFSPEGQKLLVYGLKDVHYTEEDGVITPNYEERLKEGVHGFNRPNTAKRNEPFGRYGLGYQFNPCPYKIVDNKLEINFPYDCYMDPVMMKKAYDLTVATTPNFNALSSIIADVDINNTNNKIIDAVQTYTIQVISGNESQQSAMDDLMNRLNALKYEDVLSYLNENNK